MHSVPEKLRALPGVLTAPPQRDYAACAPFPRGIPRGAITRVTAEAGLGKTEVIARFLAEQPELETAWVEERLSIYPRALAERGVALERVVFVEAGEEVAWACTQALQSGAFGALVCSSGTGLGEVWLRRIQLAAEKAGAFVLILSDHASRRGSWAVAEELELQDIRSPPPASAVKTELS